MQTMLLTANIRQSNHHRIRQDDDHTTCATCMDSRKQQPGARQNRWFASALCMLSALVASLLATPPGLAAPAAGDAYVYRLVNGYTKEDLGQIRHEVTAASTAKGTVVSVTPDKPSLGQPRTEIYTSDGQWLRRGLDSHGFAADYEFSPALPLVRQPLAAGQSWSTRVNATVPGETAPRSVRIDGEVLGSERIRVPAGEFDTVKIRRIIYSGDRDYLRGETRIVETDWYAPALGRSVRTETMSNWRLASCGRGYCEARGDWNVLELAEAPK